MTIEIARYGSICLDDLPRADDLDAMGRIYVASLEKSPELIGAAFEVSLEHLWARCWIDEDVRQPETWLAMVRAVQTGYALFEMTNGRADIVRCRIDGEIRTMAAIGPHPAASVGNWVTAFYLAVVCREWGKVSRLCAIPLDDLRVPGAETDEFMYVWADALQYFWTASQGPPTGASPGAELVERLGAALTASYPHAAPHTPPEVLHFILAPAVLLLHKLLFKDDVAFHEDLAESLELHQLYWRSNPQSFHLARSSIALPILAIACIAQEESVTIDITSGYLPKHLLAGSWVDEFEL
ncbi:immunity 49 family protein [Nocardia huaxiensis]|uniref:immunity 49 family protein n=1 Tax=Nocardia huaxiensis TaxID=2755382 RepID=UPI001E3837B1|nr:immunity 49 family protein [Nocardia huaxiensis]UFS96699.1 immunity 49 family protein [Nocardia huaxiensis]